MDVALRALDASANRLHGLVGPLDDAALETPAYPAEWTIADVLSHVGSSAVILQRRLEDALADQPTPDDFAPAVWDAWNAKSPRAKADDALVADRTIIDRFAAVSDSDRSSVQLTLGPLTFDLPAFIGLRLNEHALHTWDVAVALDPKATVPADAAALVVDNLELIARYTGKPTGSVRTIVVRTTHPSRSFVINLDAEAVSLANDESARDPDVELPAEAFTRLVYGRLDPEHTPTVTGDAEALDELRRVYPGP
ncbi:MAG: hypothetical protein QOE63_1854 [Acidimicrobiaceae bacterium]|jgi:uncharacterized protein (TIGR03083 family)